MTNFGGTGRWLAVGFSIGTKGYIGTGYDDSNLRNDFWEFTPNINGVTEIDIANLFTVYPNPSIDGKFTIKNDGIISEKFGLDIYNLQGERVFQSTISSLQSVIDISFQPSGIYFLKIITHQCRRRSNFYRQNNISPGILWDFK